MYGEKGTAMAMSAMIRKSRTTVKLRCAAAANSMTHGVTQSSTKQMKLCPTYRRHLQRLVGRLAALIAWMCLFQAAIIDCAA
jgi:hypothetical protein